MPATHDVTNQPPPLVGYDVFGTDRALVDAVARHGGDVASVSALGILAGSEQAQRWGVEANATPPVLRTHDRYGHRIDAVDFHPSWHALLDAAISHGLAGAAWAEPANAAGRHVTRAAGFLVWTQVEAGHGCPVSMSYAAVPALARSSELAAAYGPGLTAAVYDPGLRPAAAKRGLLAGMAMTEKQGGSDVRSNSTRAEPGPDGTWRLTGHKWFCSAPMCDLFLVLAQAPGGLSCFVVPRLLPDGTANTFRLQRLKDKLGNRSNASAEVEFDGTVAWLLGEPGRGVPAIIDMVALTRLDCVLGSAAAMRAAVAQAVHHATHRRVSGGALVDQPVMTAVLADLALESEAATALGLRLAAAVDAGETALLRLAVAAAKFWVCKRTPYTVVEALECLGGNGYVEESGLPRLYREAPLNSIWEGSGNVVALDVVRAVTREPGAVEAILAELALAEGAGGPGYAAAVADLRAELADPDPAYARRLASRMAVALQAGLLVRHAPASVSDAFCATRLGGGSPVFGTLPPTADAPAIVARAAPC